MGLFSSNKREAGRLLAVADGEAIPLSEVSDEAFSSGMLGIGFAVRPDSGTVYSPVDGVVEGVTETKHAYSITSKDGLEVLVHIGLDTVKLGGRGFTPTVKAGEHVRAGDVIAHADLDVIRAAGLETVIPVLIVNRERVPDTKLKFGRVRGGQSAVMSWRG